MEYIQQDKKKKSISTVAIECLEKIFEISTHEYHGGYWKDVSHGTYTTKEYVSSAAEEYIQAVRNFSYILRPFFDKDMEGKYKEILEKINNIFKEMKNKKIKYITEDFEMDVKIAKTKETDTPKKIELEQAIHEVNRMKRSSNVSHAISKKELRFMEEMFMELNLLLKRKDYLKGESYEEEDIKND